MTDGRDAAIISLQSTTKYQLFQKCDVRLVREMPRKFPDRVQQSGWVSSTGSRGGFY
jgi:hypothetical protein